MMESEWVTKGEGGETWLKVVERGSWRVILLYRFWEWMGKMNTD